jgi:light-harvesting complex II chlorophyll a/b binding protein 6
LHCFFVLKQASKQAAMALACSASTVSQITAVSTSSFVRSARSLKASPVVSFGVSNGSRVMAMATKKVSARPSAGGKKSWLPAVKGGGDLVDPQWLDGSYVLLLLLLPHFLQASLMD